MNSLTERSAHFEFGENWKDYSKSIDQRRMDAAIAGLQKLLPDGLRGKTVLDIGCGSGIHALAALSLGASSVAAVDIDENSVDATRSLLTQLAEGARWKVSIASVLDLAPEVVGEFDLVYAWGVLHHTGDMWTSIERAAALVKPDGQFALSIYSATPFDRMWKAEKWAYSRSPRPVQWVVRQAYTAALLTARTIRHRQNPIAFYRAVHARGMNYTHDVHDWLGGYPYETADADIIRRKLSSLNFREVRSFILPKTIGLFGSGCNEFVFGRCG
jgi:2-polyprenyl-3-methyl-5-hydroxy-6-metoxy-1,4-benzoquinol methylase